MSTWVRGCVFAATDHLNLEHTPENHAQVEQTYQAHRPEMLPLVGTDRVWRRLAELHEARQGDQTSFGL